MNRPRFATSKHVNFHLQSEILLDGCRGYIFDRKIMKICCRKFNYRYFTLVVEAMICGTLFSSCNIINQTPATGKFTGEPRLSPLASNLFYFYQPSEGPKFSFTPVKLNTRRGGDGDDKLGEHDMDVFPIVPEPMITSGSSTPRITWSIKGGSNLDFPAAGIIHDWLFEAHQRYQIAKSLDDQATMEKYKNYANITLNDAADIYAQCVMVLMQKSKDFDAAMDHIQNDSSNFPESSEEQLRSIHERIAEIRKHIGYSKPRSFVLWLHRNAVSRDFIVSTAEKKWNDPDSTLPLYTLAASYSREAVAKGFLSSWQATQMQAAGKAKEQQLNDLKVTITKDRKQEQNGTLLPRVYLETSDPESAEIFRKNSDPILGDMILRTDDIRNRVKVKTVRIAYYREEDRELAEQLKERIASRLPIDANVDPSILLIQGPSAARPKHLDLLISRDVIDFLSK